MNRRRQIYYNIYYLCFLASPMTTDVPQSPMGQHGGTQPGAGRIGRQIAEESALETAK